MRSSLVLAALLCFTTWMSIVHATHGPVENRCCRQWSTTRIPLERIVNYTIQSEGVCPVRAVRLMTMQGKTICSDPNSAWAIKAIRKVDEETKNKALQEQGQNEDGSTSSTTPAASAEKLTTEAASIEKLTTPAASTEKLTTPAASTEKLTTPAASTEKLTTEEMQKRTETEVEEVQEREKVTTEMSHGRPVRKNCCLQWSTTRIPLQRIVNYTIQSEGVCPIRAILFVTKRGKTVCSDPNSVWAVKAMRRVDEETKKKALQEQGQNKDGSTSDITSAASFTSKKAPKTRSRNGRRHMKRKLRRGKKGQRKHA